MDDDDNGTGDRVVAMIANDCSRQRDCPPLQRPNIPLGYSIVSASIITPPQMVDVIIVCSLLTLLYLLFSILLKKGCHLSCDLSINVLRALHKVEVDIPDKMDVSDETNREFEYASYFFDVFKGDMYKRREVHFIYELAANMTQMILDKNLNEE